jgi:CDP-2,3-bis-(O-geranylgeranyl)-sn-glycerol synthase
MLNLILTTIYFTLPGLISNMMPLFVRNKLKFLAFPVDFGLKINNKRIFGNHKTFRGFLAGIIGGTCVSLLQFLLYDIPFFSSISYIDYTLINSIFIGFLFGFGALLGDAVESTLKRQIGIKPGKPFIPLDQLDFIFGIIIFSYFIKAMSWQMDLVLIVFGFLLHILVKVIGYHLKIRKSIW